MGRRGPPPKPSATKKLEGTYRKDRAARNEVQAPAGTPARPSWLDAEGRKEWDRVVPQLGALGILADVDQAMLADYCAAHSLALKATKKYQLEGITVTVNGQRYKHPAIKIAQEARSQARLLAAEFGLSPSSRTRISVPDFRPGGMVIPKAPTAPGPDTDEQFLFAAPRLVK